MAPGALGAQAVVGTVLDASTRQPVKGAMVRLMEGARWSGVRFLTGADGRYRMLAPGPGDYLLSVERIGFTEVTAGPISLAEGSTVPFDLEVRTEPIRLEGIDVSAGRRCSLRDDASGHTQALWSEARKALDAARWTEGEGGLRFQAVQRTRTLDARGLGVRDERSRVTTLVGTNSVRTLPPEDLAAGGYVREMGGSVYYYGPDATVLLSDAFLDTHCFRVVDAPEDEPLLVGLGFEPLGRRRPDIGGTLLLHRDTGRLERVEFTYTGLGRRPGADLARGTMRFAELPDGRWIVREWRLRAPLLGLERQPVGGVFRERVVVTGVQEQGSEVLSAAGPGLSWRPDSGMAPVSSEALASRCGGSALIVGRVTDDSGEGVPGAVITAVPLDRPDARPLSAVSDALGQYALCGERPRGPLRLEARLATRSSPSEEIMPGEEGFAVRDLVLGPGA